MIILLPPPNLNGSPAWFAWGFVVVYGMAAVLFLAAVIDSFIYDGYHFDWVMKHIIGWKSFPY